METRIPICITEVDEWYQRKLKFTMFFLFKIVNQKCNTKIIQTFKGRVISV